MRKILKWSSIVLAGLITGTGVVTVILCSNYWSPQPATVVFVDTTVVTSTQVTLIWNETTPEVVEAQCGGEGVLGCAQRIGDTCFVFVAPIPDEGRSPSLAGTSYQVLTAVAVWGHELAHCVGVDIHGDGHGR